MATVSVEVEIITKCSSCGDNLEYSENVYDTEVTLDIEPCARCLEEAEDKGNGDGYQSGLEQGQSENA